jgi:uncharacterized protein DUF5684
MKRCWGRLSLQGLSVALVTVLLPSIASAQLSDSAANGALVGTMLFFIVGCALLGYIYISLALQTIATKTGTLNGWLAWIPIANIILMLNIAKKPIWWFILCLIPVVNLVMIVMIWMGVAEARHKPNWWGVMMIVPLVNFVVPGYLAWSD